LRCEITLFPHPQAMRVFGDRLVDARDSAWLRQQLAALVETHFKEKLYRVLDPTLPLKVDAAAAAGVLRARLPALLFAGFVPPEEGSAAGYVEVRNTDAAMAAVRDAQEDLASLGTGNTPLVIFSYALQHLCRIARILAMPR
jgi:dynein heavy chain